MSWSVTVVAKNNADAKLKLAKAFSIPLADAPAGLENDGERETVKQIAAVIDQCLGTFDPLKAVAVSASGHLSRDAKGGAYQEVNLSIQPQ